VQQGLAHVSSEVCLPIKIAVGHVLDLQGRVDAIFLPRMVWLADHMYACPKMIGIVDIARIVLAGRTRLIAPSIKGHFAAAHVLAGLGVRRDPFRVVRAHRRARDQQERCAPGDPGPPGGKRVALIGHFYNLQDDYIGRTIRLAFSEHGYRLMVKDQLPAGVLSNRSGFAGEIRWVYERELYNAFHHFAGSVDGACVIVSMGCGPDSLVAEFMRDEAEKEGIPFLQLVIDEHTGTAGLLTRIEAFIELMERRRGRSRAA
jgi:predicted nucleotide-binding protein (sugar kinase/HSP70/actin superfamily)